MPDDIEIAQGQSHDCNENRVPDACDIASGMSDDCNANGVLDDCEMLPRLGLTEPITAELPVQVHGALLADLNLDTMPDLIVSVADGTSPTPWLSLLLGEAGYSFHEESRIELHSEHKRVLAVDANGDGATDVVVAAVDGPIMLFENKANGSLWNAFVVDDGPSPMSILAGGDFDKDGLTDVVAVGEWVVTVYYNNGATFAAQRLDIPTFCATTPAVGDVDGDGDVDLVVSNTGCLRNDNDVLGGTPLIALLDNMGDREFLLRFIRLDAPVFGPKLVDIDADGANDLTSNLGVFFNRGNRVFGSRVPHQCGFLAQSMDIDGDGDQDFVGGQIACIHRDNRTFARRTLLSFNVVLPGDFDGDGLDDIASYETGKGALFICFNRTEPPLKRDANGDGKLDVCGVEFRRGDCTDDGDVNISDAICVFNHMLDGTRSIECEKSADVDDNGLVTVSDGVLLLGFLFLTGPGPDEQAFDCHFDGTDDDLRCPRAGGCDE